MTASSSENAWILGFSIAGSLAVVFLLYRIVLSAIQRDFNEGLAEHKQGYRKDLEIVGDLIRDAETRLQDLLEAEVRGEDVSNAIGHCNVQLNKLKERRLRLKQKLGMELTESEVIRTV